jgi:protein O-mannosyl-transferase
MISNLRTTAVCGLLLLAVALVFGQTLQHDFVDFDDQQYVVNNPQVVRGLTGDGLVWAFTASHAGNWHPLTWLSHQLDCQLYGLEPWGHHLTSVLLHAATAIVLFLVLRKMTGDVWPSAFVAAVFAVHPLRAESVAWVAERKDVLSGLFFMLTLGAYLGYARRPFSLFRYLLVVLLFGLGLMSKPMLVTAPFVLLLLDYWPLRRVVAGTHGVCLLLVEKTPLLMMSAACCVGTLSTQGKIIEISDRVSLPWRMGNAAVAYVAYLGQWFYPANLAVFYPHPGSGLPGWKIIAAVLLLAAISGAALVWRRRHPYLPVGWLWYLGMLLPVIGLVQVGEQAMADRYTYLPQIGLCLALTWGLKVLTRRWPLRRWSCGAAAAFVVAALMVCTWHQTSFWRDRVTLWTRAAACTTRNRVAHNNLGIVLAGKGRVDEAIGHFHQALAIDPNCAEPQNNLGVVLAGQGRFDEAIRHYREAVRIKPDYVEAHYNLGVALAGRGQFEEAARHYRAALKTEPNHATAHNDLGVALAGLGRVEEAMGHYRQALKINADYAEAHYNLGNALLGGGQVDEAVAEYRKALAINPNITGAHNNLANLLAAQGRVEEAISHYRKALRLDPRNEDTRRNFGLALDRLIALHPDDVALLNDVAWQMATDPGAALRNGAGAVKLAEHLVELTDGREPAVLGTLAAAYAEAGRSPEAVGTARKALDLARQQNKLSLAKSLEEKISLYQSRKAYREAN